MKTIIDELLQSKSHCLNKKPLVNKKEIISFFKDVQCILYPGYFEKIECDMETYLNDKITLIKTVLKKEIAIALQMDEREENVDLIVSEFISKLAYLKDKLYLDVLALYDGDPAAKDCDEIILCYPGLFSITAHRIAHELYLANIPYIPRILSEYSHSRTGIDIHPGATIGDSFFIDHGTGIVIGETTVIGNHVKIYQNVTIGAKSLKEGQSLKGIKRHPTIMDDVTIYAGASILGGETVIGKNCVLGSNVFITKSVAPYSVISIFNQDNKELKEI